MLTILGRACVAAVLGWVVANDAQAAVRLPRIFADHMVLQADQPLRIWGQASAGENVEVRFGSQLVRAKASKRGDWQITLPALAPSFQPQTLIVKGDSGELAIRDVLVGEVWLASGQSNMKWALRDSQGGLDAVARSADQGLRLFSVVQPPKLPARTLDVEGAWAVSSAHSSASFSAVAYWFARRLREALGRPVGIIDNSWGGTLVEAWTSHEGLVANPEGRSILERDRAPGPVTEEQAAANFAAYRAAYAGWEKDNRYSDPGNTGEAQGFAQPGKAAMGWQAIDLPAHWEDAGLDGDGAVWFRRDVHAPPQWVGQELELHLGALNDCGTIYVNGTQVGDTCAAAPQMHPKPRSFRIPGTLVKAATVVVAVRVFDERGRGGFSSPAEALFMRRAGGDDRVSLAGGDDRVSLAGSWSMRVEKLVPTLKIDWAAEPRSPEYPHPNAPHALWDAMVAPVVPFGIKGAIWYQGEANVGRAQQYQTLFPAMINDWRKHWNQGAFPFYFVQLANFRAEGHPEAWPALREAQTSALKLPRTGMAVAIDVGNPTDIHPANKLDVGERLARWALGQTYGKAIAVSGPLYERMKVAPGSVRLWFAHARGLRVAPGSQALNGFEVAGDDRRFVLAQAAIERDTVLVSATGVPRPVAVRYGWEGAPVCNLQNAEGLPASPFRTDRWAAIQTAPLGFTAAPGPGSQVTQADGSAGIAVFPQPNRITRTKGEFVITGATQIQASASLLPVAEQLRSAVRPGTGLPLKVVSRATGSRIVFVLDPTLAATFGDEGYRLTINPREVVVRAAKPAGAFYATQTLRQLLPAHTLRRAPATEQAGGSYKLPALVIEDRPRFSWRGSHVDAARHFMPKDALLKHLDLMALHKLNVFHWHLTDDQGWRLEIKKYPRLTEVGAWRKDSELGRPKSNGKDDPATFKYRGKPHGGFYSQDDVREVVRYAAERFITVVPEIEMPGHARAALAAYPELGNTGKVMEVATYWGIFEEVFNVEDRTIAFLQDVLEEVLALFPSRFIHVGGDEVIKREWQESGAARARMKALGLKNEHELQSWFIKQMDSWLAAKGRRLIGWEEILEGGLAPGAAIMSWHGDKPGIQAAKMAHDVVMTPEQPLYFDHGESPDPKRPPGAKRKHNTIEHILAWDPIPKELDDKEAKHILGAQAQLWTEAIPNPRRLEYMAWPRLVALSEVVWTALPARMDVETFKRRLPTHLDRLRALDVNYRPLVDHEKALMTIP